MKARQKLGIKIILMFFFRFIIINLSIHKSLYFVIRKKFLFFLYQPMFLISINVQNDY